MNERERTVVVLEELLAAATGVDAKLYRNSIDFFEVRVDHRHLGFVEVDVYGAIKSFH